MNPEQPASFLAGVYYILRAKATRQPAKTHTAQLRGGAWLSVTQVGATIKVAFYRTPARLGATELETFRLHCAIPAHARRVPETGQQQRHNDDLTWWMVGYEWKEET